MQIEGFRLPSQWAFSHAGEGIAIFQNSAGDTLSINYFGKVPDIAADINDAAALRSFYRTAAEAGGIAMLEVDPIQIAGVAAVRTLLKARMEPRGFVFIGCITLPFAKNSYVIKVQSLEHGITGIREAAVMAMQAKPIEVDEETGKLVGWEQDPYDPLHKGVFMRNLADAQSYDAQFPDHPLSKVRSYLLELSGQLRVAQDISSAKTFRYKKPRATIWSRLWK